MSLLKWFYVWESQSVGELVRYSYIIWLIMFFVHLYFAFNLLILVQDALQSFMFNFLISAPEPPFEALYVPETPLSISSPAQPTPATAEKRKENKPQELSKKQVFNNEQLEWLLLKSFCNFYNLSYLIFLLLPMLKVQLCACKVLENCWANLM